MAVSPIVTLGYGSWGSVNKLPTVGYGIGATVESTFTATQSIWPERKRRIMAIRDREIRPDRKRGVEDQR